MLTSSKPRQTTITTILYNIDAEIQALQEHLVKTCDIKQGMMKRIMELWNESFYILAYQSGYRWTKRKVIQEKS